MNGALLTIQTRGFCGLKLRKIKKEETIRHGIRDLKILNSLGLSLPCLSRGKISINRLPQSSM